MSPTTKPAKRLLTIREAAEYLGVKPCTIKKMRAEGELRAVVRNSRNVRYDIRDLDAWIERAKRKRRRRA